MYLKNYLSKLLTLLACLVLFGCNGQQTSVEGTIPNCSSTAVHERGQLLGCYIAQNARQPLTYGAAQVTELPGVQKRHWVLTSQHWSPNGLVQPAAWSHDVDIYIPANALTGRALLVANNGSNIASGDMVVKAASDLTEAMALSIANATNTIIVSVSNIPNQALTYADDGVARREDSSVAHSWKLFLQSPQDDAYIPLHLPMMESLVKAMDLAEQELQPWGIKSFIATGASKRAWAVWLAAIGDTRIDTIVPFVIDVLRTDQVLEHTYQSYGNHWPLAFGNYVAEGITAMRQTANFAQLLQVEDPFQYLHSPYAARLAIPKYIVNASGDDFFVPDNTRFYLDQLPGSTALRVAPNADHGGILRFAESSLITLLNRIQHGRPMPGMQLSKIETGQGTAWWQLNFTERPVKVRQWAANNPVARDFRYACGIRYHATDIVAARQVRVELTRPDQGWQATFIEAQFADGFVITTQVQIQPDTYPTVAPPESASQPSCKTI